MTAGAELQPIDAVKAMRARGIDNAEELLQCASLEAIRGACEWWDGKPGVGPGLLAKKIKEGGIEPERGPAAGSVQARLLATHAEYAKPFPIGSIVEPHARLQERRGYLADGDDPCPGSLIVVTHDYPTWIVECDRCDYDGGLPVASMATVLSGRDNRRLKAVPS